MKPERSGVGWELYGPALSPFNYRSHRPGILVTADDIPYSITEAQIATIGGNVAKVYKLLEDDNRQLVMHFKVGEVLIPPQRESVDMTAKSAAAIDKISDVFIKAMLDSAQAQLQKATTVLERVALALNEEFDMRVAQELALPLNLDMTVLKAVVDPHTAGMRVYDGRWSRMFNRFEECDEVTFKTLLRPESRKTNTFLVDMLGRKMSPGDLKRLIRGKLGGMDYGDVQVVAVYDRVAFEKTLGLPFDSLGVIGKYRVCARDPSVVRERYADSGHVFVRSIHAAFQSYSDRVDTSMHREKKPSLSRHHIYVDADRDQLLYKGKPASHEEIGTLLILRGLLQHADLGTRPGYLWEPRFEDRAPPSEFTFLEDAIQEEAETALKKPQSHLTALAFNGLLAYKSSPEWPITYYNQACVVDAFKASQVFSPMFLNVLQSMLVLEHAKHDEDDDVSKQTLFAQKLWVLLENEVGTALADACRASVQHIYDVRDEFMSFAYGTPSRALLIADAANSRRTSLRIQGKDTNVEWTDVLRETLKNYIPKNPLFRNPNP